MKRREIEFDANELVRSAQSFADHLTGKQKLTLRTKTIRLPPEIAAIKAKDIVRLRKQLALSQGVFARVLNVPKVTAISWERGIRKPTGAALRLLDIVRRNPGIVDEIASQPNFKKAA